MTSTDTQHAIRAQRTYLRFKQWVVSTWFNLDVAVIIATVTVKDKKYTYALVASWDRMSFLNNSSLKWWKKKLKKLLMRQ